MPDLLRHLETRRSIRPADLAAPGPGAAELDRMLELAVRTPDHGKLAPWRFIVFADEGRLRAGALFAEVRRADAPDATEDELAIERGRFSAPVVVAVVSTAAPHVKNSAARAGRLGGGGDHEPDPRRVCARLQGHLAHRLDRQ